MTHSSLNHNEDMPYPVRKSCRTGFRILSNDYFILRDLFFLFLGMRSSLFSGGGVNIFYHVCVCTMSVSNNIEAYVSATTVGITGMS